MKNLNIEKTPDSPAVNFNADSGILEIKGRSIADDIVHFYRPILSWIDNYCKKPHQKTVMKMFFVYYNTGTSKSISEILKKLDELHKKGFDVKVCWYYDEGDESAMEDGEDFKDYISVPIEVIESKI
ncbi:MAG: DUF1987 domain-containing protein [Cytophagales bacterium]|nr:DUF1987 domain-containing protein [Cytophagales bacterium]